MDNNVFGRPEENGYEEKESATGIGNGPKQDADGGNAQAEQTEQYYSGSTPAYSWETKENQNEQNTYSYGSMNDQSAYSSGYGDTNTNSQSVYSSGYGDTNTNNQSVYSSGYGDTGANNQSVYSPSYGDTNTNNQSVYSSGYGDTNTNDQSTYSSGYGDINTNNQSVYSSGYSDTGANDQSMYSSDYGSTTNQNVYTSGYGSANRQNAYSSTYDTQNDQTAYGNQNAQNTYAYGNQNTQNPYMTPSYGAYGQSGAGNQGYQPEMEEPVKMGDWLLLQCLLSFIPCVGLILAIVWAFSKTEKQSKVNFCKAYLIVVLIRLAFAFVLILLYGGLIIAAIESGL